MNLTAEDLSRENRRLNHPSSKSLSEQGLGETNDIGKLSYIPILSFKESGPLEFHSVVVFVSGRCFLMEKL